MKVIEKYKCLGGLENNVIYGTNRSLVEYTMKNNQESVQRLNWLL